MEVLILTIFVSLALAAAGVGFFVWSVKNGTGEHNERLALLPLEHDEVTHDPALHESTPSSS